ncbi:MAG: M20 family metallo-hydrolase [Emcibacteraceae bacterium]|nr:M20 family metallo-hydrolase [Emcibacteraceae bacterium]
MINEFKINFDRLNGRLGELSRIGRTSEGGARRLALTDADKQGRDLVAGWMRDLNLDVSVDKIGNVFGVLKGAEHKNPIMMGSHIDTVGNGGHLDGCLGVLAGLEVIETYIDHKITPSHDLCVAIFTNEEGARFQPDMMGSLVHAGGLELHEAYEALSNEGDTLKDELERIGYLGTQECGAITPYAFIELHIEQGPILEKENVEIGAVENVQGISWTAVTIKGQANHAGTTPMHMRKDAGFAASLLSVKVRGIVDAIGGVQVGTVGVMSPKPNLINVVSGQVEMTVDLRNVDEEKLKHSEELLKEAIKDVAKFENVEIETNTLARFEPVKFDERISSLISKTATKLGLSQRPMNSGAGHDAQMMARICPAAMIFVPSRDGISHNPKEHTDEKYLKAGTEVLFECIQKVDQGNII